MCSILIVSDITRFGHDAEQVAESIRALKDKGVTVYSAKEGDVTDSESLSDLFQNKENE